MAERLGQCSCASLYNTWAKLGSSLLLQQDLVMGQRRTMSTWPCWQPNCQVTACLSSI